MDESRSDRSCLITCLQSTHTDADNEHVREHVSMIDATPSVLDLLCEADPVWDDGGI